MILVMIQMVLLIGVREARVLHVLSKRAWQRSCFMFGQGSSLLRKQLLMHLIFGFCD